jgi:stage V sporulation protein AC
MDISKENAASYTSNNTSIFSGKRLPIRRIYEIGKFAGAASIVPITGFANSVISPAMEFKKEGMIFGKALKFYDCWTCYCFLDFYPLGYAVSFIIFTG